MKAISLWQPWASLIALGRKQWETRTWSTGYRGPILIHASKQFTSVQRDLAESCPFRDDLERGGLTAKTLPLGGFVAIARLVDVVESDGRYDGPDLEYGDFRAGRCLWRLEDVVGFSDFLPWRGQMGLFDAPTEAVQWAKQQTEKAGRIWTGSPPKNLSPS